MKVIFMLLCVRVRECETLSPRLSSGTSYMVGTNSYRYVCCVNIGVERTCYLFYQMKLSTKNTKKTLLFTSSSPQAKKKVDKSRALYRLSYTSRRCEAALLS